MNKQTDKLAEILAKAMFGDRFTLAQAQNIAEFKQAKTEILKHYISRDEAEHLIAVARVQGASQALSHVLVYGATGRKHIGLSRSYVVSYLAEKQQERKDLWESRGSDMRQALTTNEEE